MAVKVQQRPEGSGVWWIVVHHEGRRTIKKIGSEEAARSAAKKVEAGLILGKNFLAKQKPVVPTLGAYREKFQRSYLEGGAISHNSRRNYRATFETHIVPFLGSKRLDEINRGTMEEFIGIPGLCEGPARTLQYQGNGGRLRALGAGGKSSGGQPVAGSS